MEHDIEQMQKTLSDLRKTSECTFWGCPGYSKPFKSMATCGPCLVIQELESYLDKRPENEKKIEVIDTPKCDYETWVLWIKALVACQRSFSARHGGATLPVKYCSCCNCLLWTKANRLRDEHRVASGFPV